MRFAPILFLVAAPALGQWANGCNDGRVDRVIDDWRVNGGDAVAATYGGVRLHPVLLARTLWDEVPDEGARSLPARLVACDDLSPPGDVDVATPAGS